MRVYIKTAVNQGATQISIYKALVNAKILYLNDKFRIAENSQEYTVTGGDVTTDVNGEAVITFTPGIIASYNADTSIQLPEHRIITADAKTHIDSENSKIIYFIKFDFDSIHRISNIEQSGSNVKITSQEHGLLTGDKITIDLPLEYAGEDYTITKIDDNSFTVPVSFNPGAPATGTYDVKYPLYLTTAAFDVAWNNQTWLGIGAILHFNVIMETGDIRGNGVEFTFSAVEPSFLATLLTKAYAARTVIFWGGFINESGGIICDAQSDVFFKGKMISDFEVKNQKGISEKFDITFRAESRLIVTDTATGLQTNVESHHQYEPESLLFDQIPKLINKPLKWGKLEAKSSGSGGCLFWAALSFTTMCGSISKHHPDLDTLRSFRDAHLSSEEIVDYKNFAPHVVREIEKNYCKVYVYQYIVDKMQDAIKAIKSGETESPLQIYKDLKNNLKKFIT